MKNTEKNYKDAIQIINELFEEFYKEETKIKISIDNNNSKLDEINENIRSLIKDDDIDYNVFSPRNLVSSNKEKVSKLENEKEILEKENNRLKEQKKYYTDKTEKLTELLNIFDHKMDDKTIIETDDADNSIIVDSKDRVQVNPYSFKINQIIHKIELCCKILRQDSNRALLEMKSIIQNLRDLENK